jgi:hypothetical protein
MGGQPMATKAYKEKFDAMDVDQWSRVKMDILNRNQPAHWWGVLKAIVDQNMSRDDARTFIMKKFHVLAPRMPDID